jgi:hypothetical protein
VASSARRGGRRRFAFAESVVPGLIGMLSITKWHWTRCIVARMPRTVDATPQECGSVQRMSEIWLKQTQRKPTMLRPERLLASLAVLAALSSPVYAGESNGFTEGAVTIYTRSGNVIHKMVTDTKMLDDLTRDAMVISEPPIIIEHNGKMYMVKDKKMAGGKMMSEMMLEK